jgi:hypothetical protein
LLGVGNGPGVGLFVNSCGAVFAHGVLKMTGAD